MIELHLHLDGSLSPSTVIYLARRQGIELPDFTPAGLAPYLRAPADCAGLPQFLQRFSLPLSVMQTEFGLSEAVYLTLSELAAEGTLYAELRFAPQLHTVGVLTRKRAVQAALKGLARARRRCPSVTARLILCCMRGEGAENEAANIDTVRLAARYRRKGVAGVDLAGDESRYPTRDFAVVFDLARKLKLSITVHAGEAAGPESVREALALGAVRIGHGVRAVEDDGLVERLAMRRVALELCPSSNLLTGAVADWAQFPLRKLMQAGVLVTVSSDDRTVVGTDIDTEFARLTREIGLTADEREILLTNAVDAAFLEPREKEKLRTRLSAALAAQKQ